MASPPAWSMGKSQRSADWRGSGQPGPGQYNSGLTHKQASPSWKLGTAGRSVDHKNETPGPGSYNSPGKISTQTPKYGFGHKPTSNNISYTPGPGSYDGTGLRGYDQKSPSYSFRVKTPNVGDNNRAPGPGAYDQNSRIRNQNSPAFRMGTSKRGELYNSAAVPGPGSYSTRPQSAYGRDSGPKYGFGTSGKNGNLDQMSKTLPGPGSYAFKGDFESPGKGTSMVPRRPESALVSASRSPGPGAYNPSLSSKNQAPAYRMGSASRDGLGGKSSTPGPGNYEPRLISSAKTVKMGTSVRSPLSDSVKTPGPGSYNITSKVGEGPKYIMNPRREDEKVQNARYLPGPGAYSPSVEFVKNHQPAIGMGTSQRSGLYSTKSNPGPGQYDVRGRIAGPKWGFGSQQRNGGNSNATPGPGHYDHKNYVGDVPTYVYGNSPLKIHL